MLSSPYLISCVGCPAPLNVLSNNFSSHNLVSALHNRKRCSDTDLTIMILLKCKFYNRRNRNIKSVSLQFNKCNSPVISRVIKNGIGSVSHLRQTTSLSGIKKDFCLLVHGVCLRILFLLYKINSVCKLSNYSFTYSISEIVPIKKNFPYTISNNSLMSSITQSAPASNKLFLPETP